MEEIKDSGLSLTRKVGEKIFIGENNEIEITVKSMSQGQVKLQFKADISIPIKRDNIIKQTRSK